VVKQGLAVVPRKVASLPSEEEATEDTSPKVPEGIEEIKDKKDKKV
jgi:hypothetical protein